MVLGTGPDCSGRSRHQGVHPAGVQAHFIARESI
jgi:hypothetical protein